MKSTQSKAISIANENDESRCIRIGRFLAAGHLTAVAVGLTALTAWTGNLRAAAINVPNGSFESPATSFVDINIASWQKAPKPAYFDETTFGILWVQTAGVFLDTNPYGNRDGTQAAYLLSFPQVALSQDLSSPDGNFVVGMSYQLTLGVFGKGITDGSTLQLSLYYRDSLNNPVTVGTPTTVTYSTAGFPVTPPLNLIDYSVNIPQVQPGDAWAGKNIGIKIESVNGDFSGGNWDIDNARLIAVPEPAAMGLLALGLGGLLLARKRSRRA